MTEYGVRRAYWADTHEWFNVATIDGKPVACEPSEAALEKYAEDRGLAVVSHEFLNNLLKKGGASLMTKPCLRSMLVCDDGESS